MKYYLFEDKNEFTGSGAQTKIDNLMKWANEAGFDYVFLGNGYGLIMFAHLEALEGSLMHEISCVELDAEEVYKLTGIRFLE